MRTRQSETALLSEKSLSKAWLSKEDEEAFSYLQNEKVKIEIDTKIKDLFSS